MMKSMAGCLRLSWMEPGREVNDTGSRSLHTSERIFLREAAVFCARMYSKTPLGADPHQGQHFDQLLSGPELQFEQVFEVARS
jgi:hypothetical protein